MPKRGRGRGRGCGLGAADRDLPPVTNRFYARVSMHATYSPSYLIVIYTD